MSRLNSSMNVDEVWVANEVEMLLQAKPSRAICIVEGKDDESLYGRFIDYDRCGIVPAHGFPNVVGAVLLLDARGRCTGYLGIIDADFNVVEGQDLPSPNLVRTDAHDAEMMMIRTSALEIVIVEHGSGEKLNEYTKKGGNVRSSLLTAASSLASLRLHSHREQLSLDFKSLDFDKFVSVSSLQVDISSMIEAVKKRSARLDLCADSLAEEIRKISKEEFDPWELCRGHDVVAVLAIMCRRLVGSGKKSNLLVDSLESHLRTAYRHEDFAVTGLAEAVCAWEQRNSPFTVLSSNVRSNMSISS